ncbi:XRE family transcriptional regulator [Enterococcus faecium]|uniref:helix-turn-helix domain-containing protein n=1 Tax=Enterococcus TaxID=1350 RepID=UPI000E661BAF|nr:helix-turn-helix transcriptional regulator [Enterococcus faecium]AYA34954.1 XRE family transcriptional regulator [Enterococcus faecium]
MIENFGNNVARLRKEHGYSQEELAQKIGLKKQSISNIERGVRYPTFETLEKIAQLFNATPIQLFGTQKEIAVSDTPVILDKIDEYNSKIQAVLQVPSIIENYAEDIQNISNQIQFIQRFIYDEFKIDENGDLYYDENGQPTVRRKLQTISQLASETNVINNFFDRYIKYDDGEPMFDRNGNPEYNKSLYETVPTEEIHKLAQDIKFIKENKDIL